MRDVGPTILGAGGSRQFRAAAILGCLGLTPVYLIGCKHQPETTTDTEAAMESEDSVPTLIAAPGDAGPARDPVSGAPIYGDEVEIEALFVIDPVAGSKRLQPESLTLDGGERWIVAYRPIRSHFPYADRRVVVRGRPYRNPPEQQSVVATHFELRSIELAPGELPREPPPAELPAPPLVRTRPEFEARRGRGLWVHCAGVLASLSAAAGRNQWLNGSFRLEDGAELPLIMILKNRQRFAELVGETSTILARIQAGEPGSPIRLMPARICPGVVERCGMTLDNTRDL